MKIEVAVAEVVLDGAVINTNKGERGRVVAAVREALEEECQERMEKLNGRLLKTRFEEDLYPTVNDRFFAPDPYLRIRVEYTFEVK